MTSSSCLLCDTEVTTHVYLDEDRLFCCHGCKAVYNILKAKNELGNFRDHPVFQQAIKSGLISNPSLLEQLSQKRIDAPEEEIKKIYIEIREMWCPSCAEVIKLMLLYESGVKSCYVDYATDLSIIEFSPRYISKDQLFNVISSMGYRPLMLEDSHQHRISKGLYFRFGVAAFFTLNIMMFAYPIYASYYDFEFDGYAPLFAWLSFVSILPVITFSAWPIIKRFWTSFKVGFFGMETLVLLGVFSGFTLSTYNLFQGSTFVYFDSISVIITFVLLGKIIESRAKFSAKDALFQLSRALPRRARKRFEDGSQNFMPIKEIKVGDFIIAATGEKIVLDGEVVEGEGLCDESLMTGESIPVFKQAYSKLVSGTLLKQGWLVYRVSSTLESCSLQKIIDMIEKDVEHKSAYVRAADPIVKWFIPFIVLLASVTGALYGIYDSYESGLTTFMTLLLISCPCAIGIAAPLAESHILNSLAKRGVIVRNRGSLPLLNSITTFVFDKTGTVTEGKFTVLSGLEKLSLSNKCAIKGLCLQSTHPLCLAVASIIFEQASVVSQICEIVGRGIQGNVEGILFSLGSKQWFNDLGISIPHEESIPGIISEIHCAKGNQWICCLKLGDKIRPSIPELIKVLPGKKILLSGDCFDCVKEVATATHFTEWHGCCNPLQKRELIEKLIKQSELVCMIGDGINDAPSLTAAHIGISVVNASDMSIEVSDILLTTDNLSVLPHIQNLTRKGNVIIKQNLFWAFCYNVIGVGLAIAGKLSPVFASLAMVASSLIVLFNAKRIR